MLPFKSQKKLVDHFIKHKDQVKVGTPEEYLAKANDVISRGYLQPAKRNMVSYKDPYTHEFVVVDPNINKLLSYYIRKAYLEGVIS